MATNNGKGLFSLNTEEIHLLTVIADHHHLSQAEALYVSIKASGFKALEEQQKEAIDKHPCVLPTTPTTNKDSMNHRFHR